MAEVTYYFNVRDLEEPPWEWDNDPDYMIDNILTNYASTASSGDVEYLKKNTCPGTDLGTITKVELRCYGYGDGNDRIDLRIDFSGGAVGDTYQLTMPSSADWSGYADVTADAQAPSPWTWADVVNMNGYVYFATVQKANTMRCAKLEIRVTYTPSGGYYHGLKVQGIGELALCDVGTHPLRIRKGSTTYGIELVATDDPNASALRIKTPSGIKAIRKYT